MKKISFTVLALILTSCGGGGGGGGSSNNNGGNSSTTIPFLKMYTIENTKKQWKSTGWEAALLNNVAISILDKAGFKTNPVTEETPTGEVVGVFLAGNGDNLTIKSTDKVDIDYLWVIKNSELTIEDGATFNVKNIILNDATINGYEPLTILTDSKFSGWGKVHTTLINSGTLSLTSGQTLTVDSFTNKGTIKVTLTGDTSKTLLVSKGLITLNGVGKLIVSGGKMGDLYTLFESPDPIDVSNLLASNVRLIGDRSKKIQMKVTALASKSPPRTGAYFLSKISSISLPDQRLMHQAQKVNLNHEFSFLVNSQENSNFLALNSKSSGLYIDYKNLKNIDFGGYVMGEFGGMSLKNTLHMGSHEESISNLGEYKNRFLLLKSELGKTFKAGSWTVSPKIMGGYQQFLSLEGLMAEGDDDFHIESTSKGLFYAGIGADITAKFSSLEAFASLNLLHKNNSGVSLVRDDGESFSNSSGFKSEVTFGVHANVDKNSNLYGHMKLVQGVDHLFEVGMKVSFCD